MRKILLTGGAGYIGSHIAVELASAGYLPIILDNLSNSKSSVISALEKATGTEIKFYEGDCRDSALLERIFQTEADILGVIHLAAFKAVGESVAKPLKYYANNIPALTTLLIAMEKYGIPNLVFSSSCTVYGQPDEEEVTEKTPEGLAFSPYGATKQVCERILRDLDKSGSDLAWMSLRYFNPIGAHPNGLIGELPLGIPNNLVPYATEAAAGHRKELVIFGNDYPTRDGTCVRDYIHVVDVASAHVAAISNLLDPSSSSPRVFNIGTGSGTSVKEIIETFQDVNGVKLPHRYGKRRPGDVASIYANVDFAKEVLGWSSKYSVEDALKHAWQWQLNLEN
jgi:UDP-glucose 4-epimerase